MFNPHARASFLIALFLSSPIAFSATATINKVQYDSSKSSGSLSAEDSLRLKRVFLFPSIDDVSGALALRIDEILYQALRRNTRFDLVRDPQVIKALSPDEKGYLKAAQSDIVHREAAKVTNADTTIFLRSRNIGNETEMVLEFRDANGDILFSESGNIPGHASMDTRSGLVEKLLQNVVRKLPFEGTVTGRTANTITIDRGLGAIKLGDEIELARVVNLQRHPLLKTVIGTDYVRVARAKVTNVDKVMSFAEIIEEFPGEQALPGQKILQSRATLIRRGEENAAQPQKSQQVGNKSEWMNSEEKDPFDDRLKGDFDKPKPRFGHVGGNLLYGSLSHSQTVSGGTSEYSGSGLGGNLETELWVTKNWIVNIFYGFHSATLTGSSGAAPAGDASFSRMEGFGGYRFYPESDGEDISVTGSLGYQVLNFDIPGSAASSLGGKKYSGVAVRVDGDITIFKGQRITTGFGFQPFSSVTETGTSLGTPKSGTVVAFHLGWNYQFADSFWLKVGAQFDSASGSYENSANISDKRFAIGPGIYYSF